MFLLHLVFLVPLWLCVEYLNLFCKIYLVPSLFCSFTVNVASLVWPDGMNDTSPVLESTDFGSVEGKGCLLGILLVWAVTFPGTHLSFCSAATDSAPFQTQVHVIGWFRRNIAIGEGQKPVSRNMQYSVATAIFKYCTKVEKMRKRDKWKGSSKAD